MLSPDMASEMGIAAERDHPILLRPDQEVEAVRSAQLFHVLVMLVRGRALEILKSIVERGENMVMRLTEG